MQTWLALLAGCTVQDASSRLPTAVRRPTDAPPGLREAVIEQLLAWSTDHPDVVDGAEVGLTRQDGLMA